MAEKRMFSMTVVDSDAFLEMPVSTQALYFHLGMRADDDGFVSSPKKIMRMVGNNQNDLDILVAKRYIMSFESGIVVVKHWELNNSLRKDRRKPTVYQEEKAMLKQKENGVYTIPNTPCQPSDNQVTTTCQPSDRVDKYSIDKYSIDKTSTTEENVFRCYEENIGQCPQIVYEKLQDWQNDFTDDIICHAIKEAVLSGARKFKYINGILNNWLSSGVKVLADVEVLNEKHSKEKDKHKPVAKKNRFNDYPQATHDWEAIERKALQARIKEG